MLAEKCIDIFKNMKTGDIFWHIGQGCSVIHKQTFVSVHKEREDWIHTTTGGQLLRGKNHYFFDENSAKDFLYTYKVALKKFKIEQLKKQLEYEVSQIDNIEIEVIDFTGEVNEDIIKNIKLLEDLNG